MNHIVIYTDKECWIKKARGTESQKGNCYNLASRWMKIKPEDIESDRCEDVN